MSKDENRTAPSADVGILGVAHNPLDAASQPVAGKDIGVSTEFDLAWKHQTSADPNALLGVRDALANDATSGALGAEANSFQHDAPPASETQSPLTHALAGLAHETQHATGGFNPENIVVGDAADEQFVPFGQTHSLLGANGGESSSFASGAL